MKTILGLAALVVAAGSAQGALVFDNVSNFRNAVVGASGVSTSSTPNTFMGGAYNLAAGTNAITGFDVFPVNASGTTFNAMKITIYVWDTVNLTGTVNAVTPAYSNLLATYTLTSTGTFTTGFYFAFVGAPEAVNAGITLGAPLALADTQIGLTFNYQGSTNGGVTYSNVNSLTSLITYGTAPTVGSNVFSGYYRNAGTPTETNGNFTSSLRTLGQTSESLAVRIYGTPTPGALSLLGLGGLVAGRRRR